MIQIENLYKTYGEVDVLNDVSIFIEKSDIYGLVGSSGAGKSTLLRCMNGLESYQMGKVLVDGVSIKELSQKQLREFRKQIGMIFQNFSLLERKTVFENVALPMECWNYNKSEIKKKVDELLELVGIADKKDCRPGELSGGQKQRVAIARALTLEPKVLLCDEATSALDPNTTKSVIRLLKDINKKLGITIVVVTHEMAVVRELCNHMAILDQGTVKIKGTVEEIFLERPREFLALVGEDTKPTLENGVLVKIILPSDDIKKPILSKMARDLEVDFTIVAGQIDTYQERPMGQLYLQIDGRVKDKVCNFLNKEKIRFEVQDEKKSYNENKRETMEKDV